MKYLKKDFESHCIQLAKNIKRGSKVKRWTSSSIAACKSSQQLAGILEREYGDTSAARNQMTSRALEMSANGSKTEEILEVIKAFNSQDSYQKLWDIANKHGVLHSIVRFVNIQTLRNFDGQTS